MHTMAEIEYTLHANVKQIELLTFACNQALRIHVGQLSDPLTVLLNFEIGHARHHQGELCPIEVQESLDELTFLCWGSSYGYGYDDKSKAYWELYQIFKHSSMSGTNGQFKLTGHQVEQLRNACEQASRLRCGQLDYNLEMELMSAYMRRYKNDEEKLKLAPVVHEQIRKTFADLHTRCWALPVHADHGMNYDDDADILWDMYQVLRYRLWKDAHPNPTYENRLNVASDVPYQSGKMPLITIGRR